MNPIEQFKANQKQAWAGFATMEAFTGTVAPYLVRFAGVGAGSRVLDVGCGTGVVALTAARAGAAVTGVDLTPELVAHAKENATLARADVAFHEGDAEALAFPDASFDVVVSQFGHMFAPRPEVAISEMLRVLRPGGTIAFSTWPPELFTGRLFGLLAKHAPQGPPPGAAPPPLWGDPTVVRERFTSAVRDVSFSRERMRLPALSPAHAAEFFEHNVGPFTRLALALAADPPKLAALRTEFEALCAEFFEDNTIKQDFLLSRAVKLG